LEGNPFCLIWYFNPCRISIKSVSSFRQKFFSTLKSKNGAWKDFAPILISRKKGRTSKGPFSFLKFQPPVSFSSCC
jgi:hypothetical protein